MSAMKHTFENAEEKRAHEIHSLPEQEKHEGPDHGSKEVLCHDDDAQLRKNFEEMGLRDEILRGVYGFGFENPSLVQQRAIEPWSRGRDMIAQAQSGTGKTATFMVGILNQIYSDEKRVGVSAIVLVPTRELAGQIAEVGEALGQFSGISVRACVGGTRVQDDIHAIEHEAHVVVATPGRLLHLLRGRTLDARTIRHVAIDEADQMLDLGFREDVREILSFVPAQTQVGVFSATMPEEVVDLAGVILNDSKVTIRIPEEKLSLSGIRQFYVFLEREDWKADTLVDLFETISTSQSVIFVNSRRRCEELINHLTEHDHCCLAIHSDMSPRDRTVTMRDFRNGAGRVLVATDILARGVDVHGVGCVINFDLPARDPETYVHRIGRAGRFGRKGVAINFITPRDVSRMQQLESFLHVKMEEMPTDIAKYFG